MKVGIIGTDTSHVEIFAKELLSGNYPDVQLEGYVPFCSPDFEISFSRTEMYESFLQNHSVLRYGSPEELANDMDVMMILTVDGRNHLELYRRVAPFGKPVFIDKPIAMSVEEVNEMENIEKSSGAPFFSSSSLRFAEVNDELKEQEIQFCEFRVPVPKQDQLPGYLWYGIHTLEWLQTLMGTEARQLIKELDSSQIIRMVFERNRVATIIPDSEWTDSFEVTCKYANSSEKTFNLRDLNKPYYHSLLDEIIRFFQTCRKPISNQETRQVMEWVQWIGK